MSQGDPRIPAREQVVLRYVLEDLVERQADHVFVRFADGDSWTVERLRAEAVDAADAFRRLGVKQGDHVASFLPNGVDALRVWYGLNYLGAVYVPINPSYRGSLLAHTIATSDASLLIVHRALAERLDGIDLAKVTQLVVVDGDSADVRRTGVMVAPGSCLREPGSLPPLTHPIEPWDTQGIWYTSGTTGPSKGVLSSYMHAYWMFGPQTFPFITGDDRYMINLPLYHMGGTGLWNSMLLRGGSVSFVESFSASRFWSQIRETETTVVFLLGIMGAVLDSQPPAIDDADNPLRTVFIIPVLEDMAAFGRRFGCDVYSIYNMTEICTPIITEPNPSVPGTCGRLRAGCEVRLVDEHDCEVPDGEVGEFVVRTDVPWGMNHGYYKMPEATASAWRNGWFHTGDAGRRDSDGNYFFVDRMKDAIRRKGEFISSLELEIELCAHPDVETAAVVAVPADTAEDEIMAVLVPTAGRTIDYVEIVEFLRPRVAYFMIPRFFRTVETLPMTPTEKVRKVVLREAGRSADTWDREAAGIVVARDRIETRSADR